MRVGGQDRGSVKSLGPPGSTPDLSAVQEQRMGQSQRQISQQTLGPGLEGEGLSQSGGPAGEDRGVAGEEKEATGMASVPWGWWLSPQRSPSTRQLNSETDAGWPSSLSLQHSPRHLVCRPVLGPGDTAQSVLSTLEALPREPGKRGAEGPPGRVSGRHSRRGQGKPRVGGGRSGGP